MVEEEETALVQEAKTLEKEGIRVAECGDLSKSISIFTKSIEVAPRRASGYNNRAQAHRLKGNIEGNIQLAPTQPKLRTAP